MTSFQYFGTNEPKYIKVKGTAFIVTNEAIGSSAYFDLTFNILITINGSDISEEVTPVTPTPHQYLPRHLIKAYYDSKSCSQPRGYWQWSFFRREGTEETPNTYLELPCRS